MRKYLLAVGIIGILIAVVAGIVLWNNFHPSVPRGNIIVRVRDQETPTQSQIIIMDGNGNNIRWVGNYEGSPTWSPNGRYIAVGCEDKICILDFTTLPDRRNNLGQQNLLPHAAFQLKAPQSCNSNVPYGGDQVYSGILSMSWSPDGKNLAVVCGGETPESMRSVCILSLDDNMSCWDENISRNVYRVAWSPLDKNVMAIGGLSDPAKSPKIYLVNSKGANAVYLTDGWSPAWSPSGDKIAFMSDEADNLGIATINKDGTNRSWIYVAIKKPRDEAIIFDCRELSWTCRLSWSPDGRFITFASSNLDIYNYRLYRLDLRTGKVIGLLDNEIFVEPSEPDWGP